MLVAQGSLGTCYYAEAGYSELGFASGAVRWGAVAFFAVAPTRGGCMAQATTHG